MAVQFDIKGQVGGIGHFYGPFQDAVSGDLYVIWTNQTGIYIERSQDGGDTWSNIPSWSEPTWLGRAVQDGDDVYIVYWTTDGGSNQDDGEACVRILHLPDGSVSAAEVAAQVPGGNVSATNTDLVVSDGLLVVGFSTWHDRIMGTNYRGASYASRLVSSPGSWSEERVSTGGSESFGAPSMEATEAYVHFFYSGYHRSLRRSDLALSSQVTRPLYFNGHNRSVTYERASDDQERIAALAASSSDRLLRHAADAVNPTFTDETLPVPWGSFYGNNMYKVIYDRPRGELVFFFDLRDPNDTANHRLYRGTLQDGASVDSVEWTLVHEIWGTATQGVFPRGIGMLADGETIGLVLSITDGIDIDYVYAEVGAYIPVHYQEHDLQVSIEAGARYAVPVRIEEYLAVDARSRVAMADRLGDDDPRIEYGYSPVGACSGGRPPPIRYLGETAYAIVGVDKFGRSAEWQVFMRSGQGAWAFAGSIDFPGYSAIYAGVDFFVTEDEVVLGALLNNGATYTMGLGRLDPSTGVVTRDYFTGADGVTSRTRLLFSQHPASGEWYHCWQRSPIDAIVPHSGVANAFYDAAELLVTYDPGAGEAAGSGWLTLEDLTGNGNDAPSPSASAVLELDGRLGGMPNLRPRTHYELPAPTIHSTDEFAFVGVVDINRSWSDYQWQILSHRDHYSILSGGDDFDVRMMGRLDLSRNPRVRVGSLQEEFPSAPIETPIPISVRLAGGTLATRVREETRFSTASSIALTGTRCLFGDADGGTAARITGRFGAAIFGAPGVTQQQVERMASYIFCKYGAQTKGEYDTRVYWRRYTGGGGWSTTDSADDTGGAQTLEDAVISDGGWLYLALEELGQTRVRGVNLDTGSTFVRDLGEFRVVGLDWQVLEGGDSILVLGFKREGVRERLVAWIGGEGDVSWSSFARTIDDLQPTPSPDHAGRARLLASTEGHRFAPAVANDDFRWGYGHPEREAVPFGPRRGGSLVVVRQDLDDLGTAVFRTGNDELVRPGLPIDREPFAWFDAQWMFDHGPIYFFENSSDPSWSEWLFRLLPSLSGPVRSYFATNSGFMRFRTASLEAHRTEGLYPAFGSFGNAQPWDAAEAVFSPYTQFFVGWLDMEAHENMNSNEILGSDYGNTPSRVRAGFNGYGDSEFALRMGVFGQGGMFPRHRVSSSMGLNFRAPFVAEWRWDEQGNYRFMHNESNVGSGNFVPVFDDSTYEPASQELRFGGFTNMKTHEYLLFAGALSDSECSAVRASLASKWGV